MCSMRATKLAFSRGGTFSPSIRIDPGLAPHLHRLFLLGLRLERPPASASAVGVSSSSGLCWKSITGVLLQVEIGYSCAEEAPLLCFEFQQRLNICPLGTSSPLPVEVKVKFYIKLMPAVDFEHAVDAFRGVLTGDYLRLHHSLCTVFREEQSQSAQDSPEDVSPSAETAFSAVLYGSWRSLHCRQQLTVPLTFPSHDGT